MTTTNKKFQPNIGFWPTKSGKGFSTPITDKTMETIKDMKPGARLFLSEVQDRTNDKAPTYKLVVLPEQQKAGL